MKKNIFKMNKLFVVPLVVLLLIVSCKTEKKPEVKASKDLESESVINITTNVMDINMPDSISSGWHTFKYHNNSKDVHLILFDKYPEGKTIKDAEHEVIPVFQKGMDLIMEEKPEEGFKEFDKLPAWFFDVVYSGGIGLISPGQIVETTLKLDPGYYVVECYVKMPNGMFHTTMGMSTKLIVTDEISEQKELNADVNIQISGDEGITFSEPFKKGNQIVSVFFVDQKLHENFLGHDINLVKLDDGADISVLENWINWANPNGLVSPPPHGFTFLGGVNDMPGGNKGYFKANLDLGNYVLIAEVPNAQSKNMLKTFSITE